MKIQKNLLYDFSQWKDDIQFDHPIDIPKNLENNMYGQTGMSHIIRLLVHNQIMDEMDR